MYKLKSCINLKKKDALYVAHEIMVALDKPFPADSIIIGRDLKLPTSSEDDVLKIKYDLDDHDLKIIASILEKRNLKIEKMEDAFVIQ